MNHSELLKIKADAQGEFTVRVEMDMEKSTLSSNDPKLAKVLLFAALEGFSRGFDAGVSAMEDEHEPK